MAKTIGEKISELRKSRSLTQAGLGELLGITSQAVSRWENGESMPDILLLPHLCEALGITSDALLDVPSGVKKSSALDSLRECAKSSGQVASAFEAVKVCVSGESEGGVVIEKYDGIGVCTKNRIGLIIDGEETLKSVMHTDISHVKKVCSILSDDDALRVLRCMDFNKNVSEAEIAEKTGIDKGKIDNILLKLLKFNYIEYSPDDRYTFGANVYSIIAALCGIYISSDDGNNQVNSITVSRVYTDEKQTGN